MRKKILILTLFLLFIAFNPLLAHSPNFSVKALDFSAKAYILYCPENKKILLEKNANEKLPIASTTKIMTSLIALEIAKLKDEDVTITNEMLQTEGSSMGLKVGDFLPISSLVKGMLTVSGNDAANSIALSICPSLEGFSKLMNKKAKELGMKNSNFITPSGLDAKGHYSTAYDLALLASSAMNNSDFLKIASSSKLDVMFKNPKKISIFYNENKLLRKYKWCIGGKTGYTRLSGRCLVSCAQKDNLRLIAVTLNAPDDWNDHIKLFDYGFKNFKAIIPKEENIKISLLHGVEKYANLDIAKKPVIVTKINNEPAITTKLELPRNLCAPVYKDKIIGTITYFLDGKEYAKCNITPYKDYLMKNNKTKVLEKIDSYFKKTFCALTNFFKRSANFFSRFFTKNS